MSIIILISKIKFRFVFFGVNPIMSDMGFRPLHPDSVAEMCYALTEKKMCCAAGMSGSYHSMSNGLAKVKEAQEHQFYVVFSGPQLRLIMTKKQGSGSFVYMNSVPFRKYIRALTEKKKKIIYGRFMTLGSIYQLIFLLLDLLINVIIKQFTL